MAVDRRRVLSLGTAAALTPLLPGWAWAETYPERPVRVLVGSPVGGGADPLTRIICDWLQGRTGQAFVVDNRPGASTSLAAEAVARSPADGYTLLAASTSNVLNWALFDDLRNDYERDIAPVAGLSIQPLVLAVHRDVLPTSVDALISWAHGRPGTINLGHVGSSSISHLASQTFRREAALDVVSVPYRSAAAMQTDLLAGRLHAAFDHLPSALEHIRAGRLRALAVTTAQRSPALPQVPTVGETLPGYEAYVLAGIGAPAGTPFEVIDKLNLEINEGLTHPALNARLAALGATALTGTPTEFARLMARESDKWSRVIRANGLRLG